MGAGGFGPPQKTSSSTLVVVVCLVVLAMVGVAFAVSQGGDDDESTGTGGVPGGDLPEVTTIDPNAPDLPDLPSDPDDPGVGDPLPDLPTSPEPTFPQEPEVQPAAAAVHDCIAVDSAGYMLGTGSCADGGSPYTVVEVIEGTASCSNPDHSYTPSGGYLLCLEANLVLNHCYVFPQGASAGLDGWITVAGACKAPGTVHVVDIVPGATDGDSCTDDYEWNYWYGINAPVMVACVMKY